MAQLAPPKPALRAVVDIGSNSIHLQLARQRPGEGAELLQSLRAPVRLGALVDGGVPAATEAAGLKALRELVAEARAAGCEAFRLRATAGLRDADNGAEVAQRFSAALGLPVLILSGLEEARLTWLGAQRRLGVPRAVMVDMGGRSTELALGGGDALDVLCSLPFGHIIAAQRSPEGLPEALEPLVDAALDAAPPVFRDLDEMDVIVTAGTALTLARMAAIAEGATLDVPRHGLRVSLSALQATLRRLRDTPADSRATIPGFDPRRSDTIVPGCVMLVALLTRLGARSVLTSQAGLREGMLADWAPPPAGGSA